MANQVSLRILKFISEFLVFLILILRPFVKVKGEEVESKEARAKERNRKLRNFRKKISE